MEHIVCAIGDNSACRTLNGFDVNAFDSFKRNIQAVIDNDFDTKYDGIFSAAQKDGRGNICPTTVILPKLAMMADGEIGMKNIDSFFNILSDKLDEATTSLIERFEMIASREPNIAPFMYPNHTMAGYVQDEGIRSALKHGTLALGMVGVSETLRILIGVDHTTIEGMEIAKRIMSMYEEKCEFYKQKGYNMSPYASPAESLVGTAMNKLKEEYGEIEGLFDREYLTNSYHVPVWHELNPFEKIDVESQLCGRTTAGSITYVEAKSSIQKNIQALEKIINYAIDRGVIYFGINIPIDECEDCGHKEEMDICPVCGSEDIRRLRRVTGYLSVDIKHMNKAKQAEVKDRVKHI